MLWVLALLMIDFLVIAFSGRRGPTGLLVTPEEVLLLLHYGWVVVAAVILATTWHLARGVLGAPVGGVLIYGVPEEERDVPWTQTFRGWFVALLIQLTLFYRLAHHRGPAGHLSHQVLQSLGHPPGSVPPFG